MKRKEQYLSIDMILRITFQYKHAMIVKIKNHDFRIVVLSANTAKQMYNNEIKSCVVTCPFLYLSGHY